MLSLLSRSEVVEVRWEAAVISGAISRAVRPGREPLLETVVLRIYHFPLSIHSSCLEFNLTPLSSVPLFSLTSWLWGSSPQGFILCFDSQLSFTDT